LKLFIDFQLIKLGNYDLMILHQIIICILEITLETDEIWLWSNEIMNIEAFEVHFQLKMKCNHLGIYN